MTPMPETVNVNTRTNFHSIKNFITSSINSSDALDSIMPKDVHNQELLLDFLAIQYWDQLPLTEPVYTTESGRVQHRVFSVPSHSGLFITQERKRSNGKGYEQKPWGKTILRRLGTKALEEYMTSLGLQS